MPRRRTFLKTALAAAAAMAAALLDQGSTPVNARAAALLEPVALTAAMQDQALQPLRQNPATVRRTRLAAVTTAALPDRDAIGAPGAAGSTVRLELFDDVAVVAVNRRFEPNPYGVTWVGAVQGDPDSSVTLIYGADGLLTGRVATNGSVYSIAPASAAYRAANPVAQGTLHVITEVDQAGYVELEPLRPTIAENLRQAADALPQNDTADFVDLLVVWTPAAATYAGGTTGIQNLITLGVTDTNTSYANSGVTQRLRLSRMEEVAYGESGDPSTDLNNVTSGSGALSGVANLRNQYTADLVMLVTAPTGTGICGIAWLMTTETLGFASNGYSVVAADCISGNYSFSHELGHNMGLRHDWYMDAGTTPDTFHHGHVNPGATGNRWRTIMSYNNLCAALGGGNCTRILRWSNPTQTFNGSPLGVAPGTSSSCAAGSTTPVMPNTCDAYDAQALNNTADTVANFRQAGAPPPGAFSKTAPVDGASGIGASTTLSWGAASGATSYEYCYDTTVNSSCAGSWTNVGTATSANISGLTTATLYNWQVRAVNANGNTEANAPTWWTFTTTGYTGAVFDATLQAPKCAQVGIECDSGPVLLRGSGNMSGGSEPNQPNTIGDSCADGSAGSFHIDESIDRLRVFTLDGQPLAPGKQVRLEASTWIFATGNDRLDLYYAPNANAPAWTFLTTLVPAGPGAQTMFFDFPLPSGNLQAVRARLRYGGGPASCAANSGYDDTDDLIFAVTPNAFSDLAQNGGFTSGTTGWQTFALPDAGGMTSNVTGGVFQFYRTGTQAVVFQNTGVGFPTAAAIQAQFKLGNADTVRKRVSVLIHDSDFSDLSVCTFWLPASLPLTTYTIWTHTTKPWANATASFYAASVNGPGNTTGFYQLDDLNFQYAPSLSSTRTDCIDPTAPGPPGGAAGAEMLTNGTFGSGLSPWSMFGQINGAVNAGVFEFIRLAGNPAGVVLQNTGQSVTASQLLTATFQLGNSSTVRKRVTVILHDSNFTDLSACTFWLAPGQALANYEYRTFATQAWTNATLSVYGATVGSEASIRLDNVSMKRTPAASITGTQCLEPGSADQADTGARLTGASAAGAAAERSGELGEGGSLRLDDVWADGFASESDGTGPVDSPVWVATADSTETRTLELKQPIDVGADGIAAVEFWSRLRTTASRARVEVSLDGAAWDTRLDVEASDAWARLEPDLSGYAGTLLRLRFVFEGVAPDGDAPPDRWAVAAR